MRASPCPDRNLGPYPVTVISPTYVDCSIRSVEHGHQSGMMEAPFVPVFVGLVTAVGTGAGTGTTLAAADEATDIFGASLTDTLCTAAWVVGFESESTTVDGGGLSWKCSSAG